MSHSRPFLGISTRCVDQAQSCSRRKRGRAREDSLGWREGAMKGGPGTDKGSEAQGQGQGQARARVRVRARARAKARGQGQNQRPEG